MGNRAVARVLARKKRREAVVGTEAEVKRSEPRYDANLKRGAELLAQIEANATREVQGKVPKEETRKQAANLESSFKTELFAPSSLPAQAATIRSFSLAGHYRKVVDLAERSVVAEHNERYRMRINYI